MLAWDCLDYIDSIRCLDETLRAYCSRLDHRLIKVLRSLHTRALIKVVRSLLQLLFRLIDRGCLVHLRRHLATNIALFCSWGKPCRILLAYPCVVSHGLHGVLA